MANTYTLNPVQTINEYQNINKYDPNALQSLESGYGTVQGNINAINQYKQQQQSALTNMNTQQSNIQNAIDSINNELARLEQERQRNMQIIQKGTSNFRDRGGNVTQYRTPEAQQAKSRNDTIRQQLDNLYNQKQNLESQLGTLKSNIESQQTTVDQTNEQANTDLVNQQESQNLIRVNRENYMQALRNSIKKQNLYGQSNPAIKGLN